MMTLHRRLWPARTIFLWVILLTLPMTLPAVVSAAPRPSFAHEQRLNAGWKFLRVDGAEPPGLEAPPADDARWAVDVEAGVASVLLQAGLQPGPIRVTARVDGLLPATATITSQPAEGAMPRAPGVLPEPLPRPVPTRFTKLTGAVIGTPGAYQGEKADVTKAFDGDTSTLVDAAEGTAGNDCWAGLDLGVPKTVTKIRFFPRRGWTRRMTGGKFQGSDTPDFRADVKDLCVLSSEPKDGQWADVTDIASARAFRYVRYLSPDDGRNNVAKIEFYTSP